jgi:chromosomal replication initiator protein
LRFNQPATAWSLSWTELVEVSDQVPQNLYRHPFSAQIRVARFADGADVIDYLCELPLSGRVLAPPVKRTDARSSQTQTIGFVAGAENRLVASTLNRLMQSTNHLGAPKLLSFFGSSGTGKTHLAHGLVRHWIDERGAESAVYLTAGDFFRQLLDAIKRDAASEFRRSLRDHELLAIDDLHELPDHDYVSQELRFTLDAYEENGGTLIITSRRPANNLANISDDVRSRLASALVLQLAPPGNAARVRIVCRASELLGHPLPDGTADQLADGRSGTANELIGAVFELCAAPDGKQLAAARLARQPQMREIIAVVARYFALPQSQLRSQSRRRSIVSARAIAIYLARELTGTSYEQIGQALGGRDHTTIIHSYHKVERDRLREPTTQEAIEELSRILRTRFAHR